MTCIRLPGMQESWYNKNGVCRLGKKRKSNEASESLESANGMDKHRDKDKVYKYEL